MNKYKANIYTDFTILSFHRPTTHSHLKSTATLTPTTNPSKTALSLAQHHVLASLVKGRWIDGKAQTVALLRFACDTPPFLYCKLICRQDGGIATPTSRPAPALPKNRTIPRSAPTPLPFNERSVCFASLRNFGRSTSGIHARPRKRVRFCCSVKPSQLWWGLHFVSTIILIGVIRIGDPPQKAVTAYHRDRLSINYCFV